MLRSADEHYRRQQQIARAALLSVRRKRFGSLDVLVAIIAEAQLSAAKDAAASVPEMLAEQGVQDRPTGTTLNLAAFGGVASDGRDLADLMSFLRSPSVSPARFDRAVLTQVADAARASSAASIATRKHVGGYVRMLVPPSCGRCAVLAGKFFHWNQGFQRHPRCDCRHIAASEDVAGSLTTDPREYFDSLPTAEQLARAHPDLTAKQRRDAGLLSQEDAFTVSGAKAIRLGANPGQVVNARAGMSTAQAQLRGPGDRWTAKGRLEFRDVYGHQVYITSEGITRRGQAYRAMKSKFRYAQEADVKQAGKRYAQLRSPRLMPESILEIASDRDDAIRLLKLFGYIA